jgi:hypothetical protein
VSRPPEPRLPEPRSSPCSPVPRPTPPPPGITFFLGFDGFGWVNRDREGDCRSHCWVGGFQPRPRCNRGIGFGWAGHGPVAGFVKPVNRVTPSSLSPPRAITAQLPYPQMERKSPSVSTG